MNRTASAALAAATLAALAPASATAAPARTPSRTLTYEVSYTGRATLQFREDDHLGDVPDHTVGSLSASVRWRGTIHRVRIRGTQVLHADRPFVVVTASMSSSTTRQPDGQPPTTRTCTADRSEAIVTGDSGLDNPGDLLTPLGGAIAIAVRPFADASVDMRCQEDGQEIPGTWWLPERGGAELGDGLWDAQFELPRAALGAKKVIQIVRETPRQHEGGGCENVGTGADLARCELDWRQEVTFRRR